MGEGLTSLIILQPTPFCNIDCAYCYLPNRTERTRLSIDQIRSIFQKITTFPTVREHVTVVWHAGEPLVLNPDYYEAAFTCIKECCPPGLSVDHAFQTNGMLIDEGWCNLFERWQVGIGISIDGPRDIHDRFRKTRSGKGTFDRAVAGIKLLQHRNIPFYVLSVLTRDALNDPDALFDFYRGMKIRDVAFNLEEEEGVHQRSTLREANIDQAMMRFLAGFSNAMKKRDFFISVRELEETTASIRYFDKNGPMNNLVIPFGIVTIGVDGQVYTFSPELAGYSATGYESFAIGNIFNDSFETLQSSPVLKKMKEDIECGVSLCRETCDYFALCGGGTPSNKIFENRTFASSETLHCRLIKKRVTDFVLATAESTAPGISRY